MIYFFLFLRAFYSLRDKNYNIFTHSIYNLILKN